MRKPIKKTPQRNLNPVVEKALRVEMDYIRSKSGLLYFVETYVHIEMKDAGSKIIPFELWPMQRKTLQELRDNRLNIVLKARQLGITWLVLAYAAWLMMHQGRTVVAMSRTETEAKELVRRMTVILSHMPELIKEIGQINSTGMCWAATSMTVTVFHDNGLESTFQAFTSSPDAGRSFTADLGIFDEWAFQESADTIWQAVFPTVNRPGGGQIIGLSTPKRGTLFENVWNNYATFHKIFLPWYADPSRTPAWYEETKNTLKDAMFAEYPATPEEAWTIVGGAFFPEIREYIHIAEYRPSGHVRRYRSLDYGLDMLACYWHEVDEDGFDTIYRELAVSGLIASDAAVAIIKATGNEVIDATYAPPDLWNRNRDTGKSTFEIFHDYGIDLVMTSNDREQGWLDLKEWLKPVPATNEQTGEQHMTARMRLLRGACPYLWRCLLAIQKDKNHPNDCAMDPHEFTHGPDSIRAFAAGRPRPAELIKPRLLNAAPEYDSQVQDFFEYGGTE